MKIKTGDTILVRTGKDAGKQGKVTRAFPKTEKVLVEGVNMVSKHVKPRGNIKGETVRREMPLHVSNVALVDGKNIGRVSYVVKGDKKERVVKGKLGK